MKYQYFLVLAVFVSAVNCWDHSGEHLPMMRDFDPHASCEQVLAKIMDLMCNGYGGPINDGKAKTQEAGNIYNQFESSDVNEFSAPNWPWMMRANHLGRWSAPLTHGIPLIVKKCCQKPCSFSEILYHC